MAAVNTIVADAATLHALLQVVVSEQVHLADIEAQNRVTWLLHLAVTLADKVALAVDELAAASDSEGGAA
ncbi:MAG: hypothetical protein IPI51_06790 [Betaproteobacteria bacterium]|nr:hypothetical protein [Betaproteobacteria bacterium]MBK7515311.1 hypothetical protein [Betaproteobacteria bacterium]